MLVMRGYPCRGGCVSCSGPVAREWILSSTICLSRRQASSSAGPAHHPRRTAPAPAAAAEPALAPVTEAEDTARRCFEALQSDLGAWQTRASELEQLGVQLGDASRRAKQNREAQKNEERAKEEKELEERLRELRASGAGAAATALLKLPRGSTSAATTVAAAAGRLLHRRPRPIRSMHEDNCQICMERKRDICLVPCGHSIICGVCAGQVQECPWCLVPCSHPRACKCI